MLETTGGKVLAALTPEMAARTDLDRQQEFSYAIFRRKLDDAGIGLHGADYLFYSAEEGRPVPECVDGARYLLEQDEAVFAAFEAAATEQDLDDAYVELGHWAVFGAFEQKRLVSAASAYPWSGGSWTLVCLRWCLSGATGCTQSGACAGCYPYGQGYEPQYRCQAGNLASVALAKACGLALFGKSQFVSPGSTI